MLTLNNGATGDKLAAKQDIGTDVLYEVNGDDVVGSTDTYGSLAQGALSTSATALVGPAATHSFIVDDMKLTNTGSSTRTITLYKTKNSATYDATTQWGTPIVLLGSESCEWVGGTAWTIYDSSGKPRLAAVKAPPDPNAQSYTPGSFTVLTGTYVIIANHLQLVGTQRVIVQGTGRLRLI